MHFITPLATNARTNNRHLRESNDALLSIVSYPVRGFPHFANQRGDLAPLQYRRSRIAPVPEGVLTALRRARGRPPCILHLPLAIAGDWQGVRLRVLPIPQIIGGPTRVVAKISFPPAPEALETLRGELSTFVCDGAYADGLARILQAFPGSVGKSGSAPAVWISGFYACSQINSDW
jgi:hypothetical protein